MRAKLKRREVIALVGGVVAASSLSWPLTARAQQVERVRRVGVLMNWAADDPDAQARIGAFLQGLQQHGWSIGGNLRIDYRWNVGDVERFRRYAAELLAAAPDVIVSVAGAGFTAVQQATRTVPIVFMGAIDPVGAGLVASLARPGGNATGFSLYEFGLSGKWLELLKDLMPRATRVAVLRDTTTTAGVGQFAAIQAVATPIGIELKALDVRDAAEIERGITAFAGEPNGALIVTISGLAISHRDLIIALAARHRLPAIYGYRPFVSGGGLISYGPDFVDQYRRAAGYVDRILKGAKPADLPVQAPVKYELVINLKAAKALGIGVPPTLLARADEVIE
jgi:putative ABC transport system substrate-binding protein